MRIHLIAVGTRMPGWVTSGYGEYAKRMPRECVLQLVEIPPGARRKSRTTEQAREEEGQRMLAAIPRDCEVIALDVAGRACTTAALAAQLAGWLESGRDTVLLIGGPDGLAPACLERADRRWSLSDLTFPHALVRVIVAEQLYRAWTLHQGHPYHRS
jgi:23S rRNA (pseudouridine1915-N3)-methyltransferase